MLNAQTKPESIKESRLQTAPTYATMTMEEFLENDLEGYEYVSGRMAIGYRKNGFRLSAFGKKHCANLTPLYRWLTVSAANAPLC